jgi:hypothetical protein
MIWSYLIGMMSSKIINIMELNIIYTIGIGLIGMMLYVAYYLIPREHYDGIIDRAYSQALYDYIIDSKPYFTHCHMTTTQKRPVGWVFGKSYIAFITMDMEWSPPRPKIILYRWKPIILKIDNPPPPPVINEDGRQIIKTFSHVDCRIDSYICEDKTGRITHHGTPDQEKIVDEIIKYAEESYKNGFSYGFIALVYGPPGTGKSFVGEVLTARLNGNLIDGFNPFQYGDYLHSLVKDADIRKNNPAIVVINEADKYILNILKETINRPFHKVLREPIWNKDGLCSFLDSANGQDGLFLIITMNSNPSEIDNIDPSILRSNRISKRFYLDKKIIPHRWSLDNKL